MRLTTRYAHPLAFALLVSALPVGAAQAQVVEAAAIERFRALVEDLGAKIEWESADVSGSDAVLAGVSVGVGDDMVPIGDVTLTGISQVEDGYRVESIDLDTYRMQDGADTVTVQGVSMGGVILPDEDAQDGYGGFLFYETADVASVNVTVQGTEVFTLTDMHFEATAPQDGSPMDYSGAVEKFTVDLSLAEGSEQYPIIQALGYETIEGYMEVAGSWNPTDGQFTLSQYDMTVVDAGTLGFTFDIGGYTTEVVAALRDLQKQMTENPDGDNSAQGLAMLGLLQQLTFHSADIGFDDDSLTNKVIELVAQMQNMSAADIKNQAKAVLPFALAQLKNPEFATAATRAVSAFLDDPQSLRVTAEPAEPVPFSMLMAEGMSAPEGLIKTLGVAVTANE